MVSRPVWKGQLRLSLVSIAVEIHSATRTGSRIRFRQIHQPSGKPVRYQKVVPGIGPIESDDVMKGYEFSKDEYVLIDPDEIDAVKLETKKTLELVQFVGACEIPPLYFNKPYYVVPTDELAEDAYRVVRDALRQAEKVGVGQLTMRGREHLVAIRPCGDGLLMETLHYADEIREADPLFKSIEDDEADDDLLDVAKQLIERKTAPFDLAAYQDNFSASLKELVDAKAKSKSSTRVTTDDEDTRPAGENVIDLMDALRKSLDKTSSSSGKNASAKKKPAKSRSKSSRAKKAS